MTAVPSEDEMLSQQLIARLLDEEGSLVTAEALQLRSPLQDSAPKGKGRRGQHLDGSPQDHDDHVAIKLMANEAWAADSVIAQHVHDRKSAQTASDRQYAMKLAATELDMEFAKALQRLEDARVLARRGTRFGKRYSEKSW
jgi:hypothetical protein